MSDSKLDLLQGTLDRPGMLHFNSSKLATSLMRSPSWNRNSPVARTTIRAGITPC